MKPNLTLSLCFVAVHDASVEFLDQAFFLLTFCLYFLTLLYQGYHCCYNFETLK